MGPKSYLYSLLFRPFTASTGTVSMLARLVVGYGFIQHGFAKVLNGPERFAAILDGLGIPVPHIMSWLTIVAELLCGFAILIGSLVPLMCLLAAVILLVAMFYVHLPFGFSSIKLQAVTPDGIKFGPPGYEVNLVYLVCISTLIILGAGPLSVDSWLKKKFK